MALKVGEIDRVHVREVHEMHNWHGKENLWDDYEEWKFDYHTIIAWFILTLGLIVLACVTFAVVYRLFGL